MVQSKNASFTWFCFHAANRAAFALTPHSYEETIANAIFLGGDTDTVAAMAGAVSGAFLGMDALPKDRAYIREFSHRLFGAYDDRVTGET